MTYCGELRECRTLRDKPKPASMTCSIEEFFAKQSGMSITSGSISATKSRGLQRTG